MTDSHDDNKNNVIYLSSSSPEDYSPKGKSYQHYYLKGVGSLDKDKRSAAIDNFTKAIDLNPENWELRLQLFNLLIEDKKYDLAKNHLKYLRRKFESLYILSTYLLAQVYGIINKPNKAIRCFKQCLKKLNEGFTDEIGQVDEIEVRQGLAIAYYNAGHFNKAAFQLLEKIFSRDGNKKDNIVDINLLINIIIQSDLQKSQRGESSMRAVSLSLDFLRQKTKENDNDYLFHLSLGKFYEECTKSLDMSLYEYRKAYSLSPHDADVIYCYGRALRLNGQIKEAYDILYKGRDDLKENVEYSTFLGFLAIDVNCLDEAREIFVNILREDPDNLEALVGMGDVERNAFNYAKAIEYLNRARAVKSDDPKASFILGLIYLHQKEDISKAIKLLNSACKLDPENSQYHLYYGDALAQDGQNSEAKAAWRKAADLDSQLKDNVRARFKRLKNSGS